MDERNVWWGESPTRNDLMALVAEGDLSFADVAIAAGDRALDPTAAARLERLQQWRGEGFHADLWFVLTHQRLAPQHGTRRWREALAHKQALEESLGRPVGVAVAALDLLHNRTRQLDAPVILDARRLDRIASAATLDTLTGVLNRGALDAAVARELARARREHGPLSALMVDVDHFKLFNDAHGHVAGDATLHEVVDCCLRSVRAMDVVGRYGGEELCVVLPGATLQHAYETAERIRVCVAAHCEVTISVGVAEAVPHIQTVNDLYGAADAALYAAKHAGRNCTQRPPRAAE